MFTLNIDSRDTGTNLPAVSVNFLLEVAMTKVKHFWNETGVPTQSLFLAASHTNSACNVLDYSDNNFGFFWFT
jgi:hypothetical protein